MKSATEYIWFQTEKKREFINITARLEQVVTRSEIGRAHV